MSSHHKVIDVRMQLLDPIQMHTKTFRFAASDSVMKHGSKWVNCVIPILMGIALLIANAIWPGILFLVIGIAILVIFCALEKSGGSTTYTVSFNAEERVVGIYGGHYKLYSIPYNEFSELWFEVRPEEYCVFCCLGCGFRSGTRRYCAGCVYAVLRNSTNTRINNIFCAGVGELARAKAMVAKANRYYKVDRYNEMMIRTRDSKELNENDKDENTVSLVVESAEKEPKYEEEEGREEEEEEEEEEEAEEEGINGRIPIGSFCYVDCETVHGVVIGYLPSDYYTIIDLFEKRERRAWANSLTVIADEHLLSEITPQYEQFLNKI